MRNVVLLALTLSLTGLACQDRNFNRPELLKAPRVLAIQAEPPQPTFGTSTTLRPLIYQPAPNSNAPECAGKPAGATYRWSWCPLPTSSVNNFACPVTQTQLDQMYAALGLGPAPILDLGDSETASLTNPFPASLLRDLCKGNVSLFSGIFAPPGTASPPDAGVGSIFSCALSQGDDRRNLQASRPLGFPVTVTMVYTPPCGSPPQDNFGDTLTTVFTVHLPVDESVPPNQNPALGKLFATSGVDPDAGAASPPRAPDAGGVSSDDGGNVALDGGATVDGGETWDGGGGAWDGGGVVMDAGQPAATATTPPAGAVLLDSVPVPRQKRVGLWLELPLADAEFLPNPGLADEINIQDQSGNTKSSIFHFERLYVSWFAEAGEFGADFVGGRRTGYQPAPDRTVRPPSEEDLMTKQARENRWTLPKTEDYAESAARIIVVVRDSRGGVAWTSTTATLESQP